MRKLLLKYIIRLYFSLINALCWRLKPARRHTRGCAGIIYRMKLLEQILAEMGGETLKSFTVVPCFGGYFRNVKAIAEYSPEKIKLNLSHGAVLLTGEKLEIGKYFEEDIFIKGNIKVIEIE